MNKIKQKQYSLEVNQHTAEEDAGQTSQHILFHWRWLRAGQAESQERGHKIFCESETCPLRTSWACCYMQPRPCSTNQSQRHNYTQTHASLRNLCVILWQVKANLWKVSSGWQENYINYSNTIKNNILFYRRFGFTSEAFIRTDYWCRSSVCKRLSHIWDKLLHTDDRHRKSVLMKASDVKPKRR